MWIDIEDLLAGIVGKVVLIALFFLSAIWLGSLVGGVAILAGKGASVRDFFEVLIFSPILEINLWIIPNVALLAGMLVWILVNDSLDHAPWGIVMGAESLFVMLGWGLDFSEPIHAAISWASWLMLLVMAETGVWFIQQWRRQVQIQGIMALKAENWAARAVREAGQEDSVREANLP